MELILEVLFLSEELRVKVLMLVQITLQSRNFNMPIVEAIFLAVELSVKIRVLLFSINKEILLVIDLLSQGLDHVDVNFNSASVVLLHSSLIISYSIEVLLEREKLVLEVFVFSFSGSEVHSLLSELGY